MLVDLEQTSTKLKILNEFESPFDVFAISETWLESDDCTDIMIQLKVTTCDKKKQEIWWSSYT